MAGKGIEFNTTIRLQISLQIFDSSVKYTNWSGNTTHSMSQTRAEENAPHGSFSADM
uniref:Uncharacterized protein n=1 Tax=Arundo donax TaxID=35708 RepID=A0A0A9D3M0_ARUDO